MKDFPPDTDRNDPPPGCAAFEARVNRVLDGELPPAELDADPHPASCPECRSIRRAVPMFVNGLRRMPIPVVPPEFAERATRAAVADYRRRRMLRSSARLVGGALAASLLAGIWLASPRSPLADRGAFTRWWPDAATVAPAPKSREFARTAQPAETITDTISEAGSAVVSLTRKASDDTFAPARNLFSSPPAPKLPAAKPSQNLPDAITELPESAKAGLEPLTNTARRAVNLFIRDVGSAAGAGKMKS